MRCVESLHKHENGTVLCYRVGENSIRTVGMCTDVPDVQDVVDMVLCGKAQYNPDMPVRLS